MEVIDEDPYKNWRLRFGNDGMQAMREMKKDKGTYATISRYIATNYVIQFACLNF